MHGRDVVVVGGVVVVVVGFTQQQVPGQEERQRVPAQPYPVS
jgi:hypothetical protein